MADLDTVRALIADKAVYVKEAIQLFASAPSCQVGYFPLVSRGSHDVIITLADGSALNFATNPYTVDLEGGVITFTGTVPSPQLLVMEYSHVSLTDASIQAILDFNVDVQDVVRLSAADCLDAIASAQAVIEKKIKLLDMETDGAAIARALRDHAKTLRQLVFSPDYQDSTFDVTEEINDVFGFREKVIKDWLREAE